MIVKIIKFQIKERLTHWISLVFFLMLVFQGIWYTKGTFDYYVNDGVLMNAPSIFYQNFAGLGMLMVIMIVILTGGFLYKDIQHKTSGWVYTLPINEKKFFVGRFFAAYLVNIILAMGYFVGMLLVPYSGIGEAHRFGPAPIGQMLHGVLIFLLPNVLLFNSIIISTLVFTKKMAASYLAAFGVIILFLIGETTSGNSGFSPAILLGDPNGYVTIKAYLEGLTTLQKNTDYIQVSGYLLVNRLIWLSISIILFVLAYRKFSFKDFVNAGSKKKKKVREESTSKLTVWTIKIPIPKLTFGVFEQIKKSVSLSSLEFSNIVRPSSFRVIIGVLALMVILQNIMWNASFYIGPEVPLTSSMTYFRLPWGVIITILLMIWAGELFFKDKTINIWQITDALPVPVWVTQTSRLVAMIGVTFVLCASFIIIGILCQVAMGGFAQIDLPLYITDVLGYRWGWLNFASQICMVFFIGGLTGNRITTHILSVGIFFITIISFDQGLFEQVRYGFPLTPGLEDYSEMSGYGIWAKAGFWFYLMWAIVSITFVLLGILFWDRGVVVKWYSKLTFTGKQLNTYGKIAIVFLIGAFFALQSFIGKQAYSNGNFKSSDEENFEAADYELKYKKLKESAHPKYQEVYLKLDYYPEERKAIYNAELILVNPAAEPIEKLYLSFEDFITIEAIRDQSGELKLLSSDSVHHVFTYQLNSPLDSAARFILNIDARKQYIGFSQSGENPQPDLMFNGSYGNVHDFLPVIGYDEERELDINRDRVDNGLDKLESRMASLDDEVALKKDAFASDADWVTGKIALSTSSDQITLAPGKLMKQWTENERNYFEYHISKPAPFNWYIGSAEYVLLIEGKIGETDYQVLADDKHKFNTEIYQDAITKGITFVEKNLGSYPYKEVRLVEINRYHDERYAFTNVIAISEKEGWVADTKGLKERAYLYLTVVSELTKHWVNQHVHVADVQGADMLKVALPEAIALKFIEESLGIEAVNYLIDKKMELYGKEHNNEPNTEPSLLYADGADYLEINKGAIALYKLIGELGKQTFYETLREFGGNETNKQGYTTFKAFYEKLLAKLPVEKRQSIITEFEEVN